MELPVACGFAAGARLAGGEAGLVEAWPMWQRVKDARLSRAVVRLGWMARLYFVGAGADEVEVVAGDLGPAGAVLDMLCLEHFDLACDVDGAMAAKGRVLPEMLNELLSNAWFQRSLPKRAKASDFSQRYRKRLEMISRKHGARPQDELATVTEMVARLVDRGVSGLTERPHQVALVGGGSANITLAGRIRELLSPCSTVSAEVLGLEARSSRAEAAAMLAAARHAGRVLWSPQATGARSPAVLGTWIHPGRG
jgi:anhydro-N-acetylmuramic acid kinase